MTLRLRILAFWRRPFLDLLFPDPLVEDRKFTPPDFSLGADQADVDKFIAAKRRDADEIVISALNPKIVQLNTHRRGYALDFSQRRGQ